MTLKNGGGVSADPVVSAVLGAMGKRYLVESVTAEDGSYWYNRYSDGWIEQGGREPFKAQNRQHIQLPVGMSTADYSIEATVNNNRTMQWLWSPIPFPLSTTEFDIFNDQGALSGAYFVWRVEGYAA